MGTPTVHDERISGIDANRLYQIITLRLTVFGDEQKFAWATDLDGRDLESETRHLWIEEDEIVQAYLRLTREDGLTWRLGRVATRTSARRRGHATRLNTHALDQLTDCTVVINAESHLEQWYERFGFTATGTSLVVAGIPHVEMIRLSPPGGRIRAHAGELTPLATVRPARPDELTTVQTLNRGSFANDQIHDPHLHMDWPFDPETGGAYFRRRIEGEGICLVAEHDTAIAGYLAGAMTPNESYRAGRRAELENMFVAEGARRSGAGSALVARFREWSLEHGADEILVSAHAGNDSAVAFYQACGFTPHAHALLLDLRERLPVG